MALQFQERTDGYRVVRIETHTGKEHEQLVAAMTTKRVNQKPPPNISDESFTALSEKVGVPEALKARDQYAADRKAGVTLWEPLPRGECQIHSAGGPLSVSDIEEMLDHLSV